VGRKVCDSRLRMGDGSSSDSMSIGGTPAILLKFFGLIFGSGGDTENFCISAQ
jgi:hypothetical protein